MPERAATRVALVTGGSRGIGLGVALRLARDGFALAVNGVRAEADARESLEAVRAQGAEVIYCRGDVSSPADRQGILDRVRERFGRLDVLVNNAGVAPKNRQHVLEATEESFEYVVRTNLQGPYFLTQAVARWMIEQRQADGGFSGCIVNVGSISATVASINRGEYCVSKAGIAMMTRLWAVALGEYAIPVYEVQPGVIDTDMTSGVKEKYDRLIDGGLTVQNRWGTAEDVGRVVAAMARGDMPYSTGQVVMVDGGLTLPRL
jgi:3-oxoacyl-[acyl-carrier protein] reductase